MSCNKGRLVAEHATARKRLRALLDGGTYTVKELSEVASLSEREVNEHLEHLKRTLHREGRSLSVEHAICIECDFEFKKRERTKRPGKCPVCKSERIAPPRFFIE